MLPHNRASNVNSTSHDTLAERAEALSKWTTCALVEHGRGGLQSFAVLDRGHYGPNDPENPNSSHKKKQERDIEAQAPKKI